MVFIKKIIFVSKRFRKILAERGGESNGDSHDDAPGGFNNKVVHEVGDIPGRGRRMSPDGDESTGPC